MRWGLIVVGSRTGEGGRGEGRSKSHFREPRRAYCWKEGATEGEDETRGRSPRFFRIKTRSFVPGSPYSTKHAMSQRVAEVKDGLLKNERGKGFWSVFPNACAVAFPYIYECSMTRARLEKTIWRKIEGRTRTVCGYRLNAPKCMITMVVMVF